jgi:hypothetical protein
MAALTTMSGFTPVFDALVRTYGRTRAEVFGVVWRYCQMRDRVCRASQSRLASELDMCRDTVSRHIGALVEDGYLEDLTPDLAGAPHTYRDTGKLEFVSLVGAIDHGAEDERGPKAVGERDRVLTARMVGREEIAGETETPVGQTDGSVGETDRIVGEAERAVCQTGRGVGQTDRGCLRDRHKETPKIPDGDGAKTEDGFAEATCADPVQASDPEPIAERRKASPAQRAHRALFGALAQVCSVDPRLKTMRGLLNRTAGELRQAGYDADTIRRLFGPAGVYWRRHWKGKRRQPPGPVDVIQSIQYLLEQEAGCGGGNGHALDMERITRESIASLGVTG